MIAETIYGGGNSPDKSFWGLLIVILFGADYRLSGGEEGGLSALFSRGGGKMTQGGRHSLLECAECVMELKGSQCMKRKLKKNRRSSWTDCVSVTSCPWTMLRSSLHLDAIEKSHGKDVTKERSKKRLCFCFSPMRNAYAIISNALPRRAGRLIPWQFFGPIALDLLVE